MSLLLRRSPQLRPGPPAVIGEELVLPVAAGAFTLTGQDIGFALGTVGDEWWESVPLLEWTQIPNSALVYSDLGTAHILATGATINANVVTWGANENGYTAPQNTRSIFAERGTYGGMAENDGKIYLRNGDPWWGENGVQCFDLVTCTWTAGVIVSSLASKFDNQNIQGGQTQTEFMLDGKPKGCHSYYQQHVIGARGWFCHFSTQQWWPNDLGGSAKVHVADLATGQWLAAQTITNLPHWSNDWNGWQQKHPTSEDVYITYMNAGSEHYLYRWNQSANTWTVLAQITSSDGSGSIDWENGEILFAGGSPFVYNIGTGNVQAVTFPFHNPGKGGAIHWCPDRGKHLGYFDWGSQFGGAGVVEFTRTANNFAGAYLELTGDTPPAYQATENNKGGLVYNNWKYVPEIKGMVFRPSDQLPMYYIRTGT